MPVAALEAAIVQGLALVVEADGRLAAMPLFCRLDDHLHVLALDVCPRPAGRRRRHRPAAPGTLVGALARRLTAPVRRR